MTDPSPRFYYGWVNVLVGAVAMTATLPGRTYGLGLVKEPLRADLGISDERFAWLNFWAIILGSAAVLPVGWLIDRLGTRLVGVGVSLLLGASVLAMSRVTDETQLAVTLTLVRGLGQGALSVVAIALVGKWFRRRIGVAMGLFTVLLGVGFVIPPFVVKGLIEGGGWRHAWAMVGWSLLVFAAVAALFARSTPESFGVKPDDPAPAEPERPGGGVTLWRALANPAFWVYTAAGTHLNLVFSAVTLDNDQLLAERGLTGAEATILAALFLAGLPANLLAGYLSKRVSLPTLLAVGAGLLAATVAVFPFVRTPTAAAGYAALLGASGGIITVVYFAIYGWAYGRAHLGHIQAAAQVCSVFASALGPLVLTYTRSLAGGTDGFFFGCAAVAAVLAVLVRVVRAP